MNNFISIKRPEAYKLYQNNLNRLFYKKDGAIYKVQSLNDLNNKVLFQLTKKESESISKLININSFKDTFSILGIIPSMVLMLFIVFLMPDNNILDNSLNTWWNLLNTKQQFALVISTIVCHFSWHHFLFHSNFSSHFIKIIKNKENQILEKYL
jgi:hypothetical protein